MKDFDRKHSNGSTPRLVEVGNCKLCGKLIICSTRVSKSIREKAKYCSNKCRLNAQKINAYKIGFRQQQ